MSALDYVTKLASFGASLFLGTHHLRGIAQGTMVCRIYSDGRRGGLKFDYDNKLPILHRIFGKNCGFLSKNEINFFQGHERIMLFQIVISPLFNEKIE